MSAIAPSEAGLSVEMIEKNTELASQVIKEALEKLKQHDIVREEAEGWKFTVELMRRWVLATHGG